MIKQSGKWLEIIDLTDESTGQCWTSLADALQDPNRKITLTIGNLRDIIDFEVSMVKETEQKVVYEKEIIGESSENKNWLNGNQVAIHRKMIKVESYSEKTGKTRVRSLSQTELASEVGTCQSLVSDLERVGYFPVREHPNIVDELLRVLGPYGLVRDKLLTKYNRGATV